MRYTQADTPHLLLISRATDAGGNVVAGDGHSHGAAFSPDGRWVAFVTEAGNLGGGADGDGGAADIRFVRVAGGASVDLTPASLLTDPAGAAAVHGQSLFSPIVDTLAGGASVYTLVLGSTSAGVAGEAHGADPQLLSDLYLLQVEVDAAGQVTQTSARALTTAAGATPVAWSPDGTRVVFTSAQNLDGNAQALDHGLFEVDVATGAITRLASADQPFGKVLWGQDGASIVFDSTAVAVDATGDGASDLQGSDANGVSDVFVLRLGAPNQVERLTSFVSNGNALPSVLGSFVTDGRSGSGGADGSLALTMTTDLVLPPAVDFGGMAQVFLRSAPQVMVVTGRTDTTAGRSYATIGNTAAGGLAAGSSADTGSDGGDREPTGIAFDSAAPNLHSAPVLPLGETFERQVYLHGPQLGMGRSWLVSQGEGGSAGDAPSHDPVLLSRTLNYPDLGLSLGSRDTLPLQALVFETEATNLMPELSGSTHTQIVLAALEPATSPDLVLDYGPGGAQSRSDTVFAVRFNAASGSLVESDAAHQDLFTGSVSSRMGRVIAPQETVGLVAPAAGEFRLGRGDDRITVVGDGVTMSFARPHLLAADSGAAIDGGDGEDVLDGQRMSLVRLTTQLQSVEVLRFDPETAADEAGAVELLSFGQLPVQQIIGSAGTDELLIVLRGFPMFLPTLDLRGLSLQDFGNGSDLIEVRLEAAGTVVARDDVPLHAVVTGYGNQITGGAQNDHFDLRWGGDNQVSGGAGDDMVLPGPGADHIDGGSGFDTLDLYTPEDPLGLFPVEPMEVDLQTQQHVGSSVAGDTLAGIEQVLATSAGDTLSGDAAANWLDGRGGDDVLTGRGGDDTLVGGEGDDVAVFSGSRPDYRLLGSPLPTASEVSLLDGRPGSPEGADSLIDIELFRFGDGDYTLQQLIDTESDALAIRPGASVTLATEGTPPGPGGLLQVALWRGGDVSQPASGTYRLLPATGQGLIPVAAEDVVPALNMVLPFAFAAGSSSVLIDIRVQPDSAVEANESLVFELLSASGASLPPEAERTLVLTIGNDDLSLPGVFPTTMNADFTPGGPLNPGGAIHAVLLDLQDHYGTGTQLLREFVGGQLARDGVLSDRTGRPYGPGDSIAVGLTNDGQYYLGDGDDIVYVGDDAVYGRDPRVGAGYALPSAYGGDGIDTVWGRAGTSSTFGHLSSFEQVRFDPAATPAQTTTILYTFDDLIEPGFLRVIGSPGIDRLVVGGRPDQDYRPIAFVDFGAADLLVVDLRGVPAADVHAHPSLRALLRGSNDGGDVLRGGELGDRLEGSGGNDTLHGNGGADDFDGGVGADDLYGGQGDDTLYASEGDDRVDGGEGDDLVVLRGLRDDYEVDPAGAAVGRFAGAELVLRDRYSGPLRFNEGTDAFFGVERFRFDDGLFTLDQLRPAPAEVVVSIDDSAGVLSVDEGSGNGGVLQVRLERTLDLSLPVSGTWRLVADSQATDPLGNDDLSGLTLGAEVPFDFDGQRAITVQIPLVGDTRWEFDESVRFEIASVNGGRAGIPSATTLWVGDDDAFAFSLQSATSVAEGASLVLTVVPDPGSALGDVDRYLVDWGDGQTREIAAAELVQLQGRLVHVYTDGAAGGSNRSVSVTAIAAPGLQSARQATVRVDDVAPALDVGGAASVDFGQPYMLQLGAYLDPGDDPLQRLVIDWNDGSTPTELTGALPADVQHVFAGAGTHRVRVSAHNDDGSFEVDRQVVRVMPPAGTTVVQFIGPEDPVTGELRVTMHEGRNTVGRLLIERMGDLSLVFDVQGVMHPHPDRVPSIDPASDVRFAGWFSAQFLPGESVVEVASDSVVNALFPDDGVAEGREWGQAILTDTFQYDLGPANTASVEVVDLPLPPLFLRPPHRPSFEGEPATFHLHASQSVLEPATVEVQWGDGGPTERFDVPAGQFAAAGGSFPLTHRFGDVPVGGRDVHVVVTVSVGQQVVTELSDVHRVDDALPRVAVSGPGWVKAGATYTLNLGTYVDIAADPLQRIVVDWGDGSTPTVIDGGVVPPTLQHLYPSQLADYTATVRVRNDDGEFVVGTLPVNVVARLGGVAAATPVQVQAAWTDALVASITHKADLADPGPATAVSFSTVNSAVLAGGDIYSLGGRGLLGVSGRTQTASTVRQEIDGTEALIVDLADGQLANRLVADLALFFRSDPGGTLREGMRALLYNGDTLVGQSLHLANTVEGRQRVVVNSTTEFDRVVLQAGVDDATGAFVPGAGRHPGTGAFVMPSATAASEFLLDGLTFLNTDDPITLVGLPAYGP